MFVVVCGCVVEYNNYMTVFDGIILGILQGFTEFIPVSSSGHLVIAQYFLGIPHSATFDSLINLGTFLALVVYFRGRLWDLAIRLFKDHDIRLARNLAISAVPVLVIGFFFKDFFESALIQNPWVVVFTLVAIGVVMIVLEKLPRAATTTPEDLTVKRAGGVGLAQMLALVPGVSRSGATIVAGRLAGLSYAKAAEYSFLLSIPVMFAVVVLGFLGSEGREFITTHFWVWALSNLAAFVAGLVAVGFMLRFLAKGNLVGFGVYRIGLAAVVALLLILS